MRVVRVPRDADDAEHHVERHGDRSALPAQCRTGQEHPKGLTGDRHRGEREVNVDLRQDTHEECRSDNQRDVGDDGSRNQVSEDTTL